MITFVPAWPPPARHPPHACRCSTKRAHSPRFGRSIEEVRFMRRKRWRLWFAVGLVALSTMLFGIHFLVFRDWHHLAIYTLGDIAFVPLEVLFVALILHELLDWHERRELQNKLKMLIGA